MKRTAVFFCILFAAALAAGAQSWNLKTPLADKPAFLTSIGQSADIEMLKVLLDRAKVAFKADPQINAAALKATGAKTLILAIGGSSKGLGAAGISTEAELERAKAIFAETKKLGIKVIGLHVGGEGRRGELSDKFIVASLSACDYVIVVADGNKDGLFTKLCAASKVILDTVDKISKAGEPLARAFK